MTTVGALCPKPESFETCWMQVYHQICLDFVALESRRFSNTRSWISGMWKTYTGEIVFRLFRVESHVSVKVAKILKASEGKLS